MHPTVINKWNRALLDNAAEIFDRGHKAREHNEAHVDALYRQIGQSLSAQHYVGKIRVGGFPFGDPLYFGQMLLQDGFFDETFS